MLGGAPRFPSSGEEEQRMIGCRVWAIPEGHIPCEGLDGHVSHEAA
jgi:hypothetical protein